MKFLEKLTKINRRVIFLLVALAVIIPLVVPLGLPVKPGKYSKKLYDVVDNIPPNNQPVLISADYSPSMMPELHPMFKAMVRHCFAKKIRVLVMTLDPTGAALAEDALNEISKEYPVEYGKDYVFLGFKSGYSAVMMAIGQNIRQAFPADAYGKPLDDFPMMAGVRNYADIPLVVSIAGSAIINSWVNYAGTRYHAKVGAGCTAVSTADYYPFLQAGQLVGLLNGMKGASEYEYLNQKNGYSTAPRVAGKGMDAVSIVHLLLMAFIILGNIGYLVTRHNQSKKQGA
ncbi:hypothetical protein HY768_02690 [candidate division TA06 bacterium]|uniref:Uncharacterized protein n=1 Tax=candidate division TA06 bacterium TaxID=2250710 RepID=A0A933MK93_UNCT6|nr:hypothetical protein [candidate division TA06 bacterium]